MQGLYYYHQPYCFVHQASLKFKIARDLVDFVFQQCFNTSGLSIPGELTMSVLQGISATESSSEQPMCSEMCVQLVM